MFTETAKNSIFKFFAALLLVIAIFAVYGQVATHNFVLYDDNTYIIETPAVLAGLTSAGIAWAFSSLAMANWHPLTWLSYMLDIQLFGPTPGVMLLENVALHAINTILLLLLLNRLTGYYWRSLLVAALFALHPLHVESVAWIAERKDVLSTFFWLLTLLFYARYAEQHRLRDYIQALATFTLGLLAKPMLVTLPAVLLLLDYWPLQRFSVFNSDSARQYTNPLKLIAEKLPFFSLAAGSCIITIIAQQGAMTPLAMSSLTNRFYNSLNSYVIYLGQLFWPVKLCPFYPFPSFMPLWQPICSALIVVTVTILAFRERKRRRYLIVGWLWYLITLLPVIGIIRVGMQAMADRYTYIPLIGIFIMLVWGVADLWPNRIANQKLLIAITTLVLTGLSLLTWRQVSYWRDPVSLFTHTREVSPNNFVASCILGTEELKKENYEEALKLLNESFSQAPWYIEPYISQGVALHNLGRIAEAAYQYKQALIYFPEHPSIHNNLGISLAELGMLDEAILHFRKALQLKPGQAEAQRNLNKVLELKALSIKQNTAEQEYQP